MCSYRYVCTCVEAHTNQGSTSSLVPQEPSIVFWDRVSHSLSPLVRLGWLASKLLDHPMFLVRLVGQQALGSSNLSSAGITHQHTWLFNVCSEDPTQVFMLVGTDWTIFQGPEFYFILLLFHFLIISSDINPEIITVLLWEKFVALFVVWGDGTVLVCLCGCWVSHGQENGKYKLIPQGRKLWKGMLQG